MGNVFACSPSFDSTSPTMPDKVEPTVSPESGNPGSFEELHKQCTDVFPMVFEGGRFVVNRALSNHLQLSHVFNFSTIQPPGYKFNTTYIGTPISQTEAYPLMAGEIDASGNLSATMLFQFMPKLKTKFVAQFEEGECQVAQFASEYKGACNTTSLTLLNVDPFAKRGLGIFHYLHQITDRITLGGELAMQSGPAVPGGFVAVPTAVAKYKGDDYIYSGSVGSSGLHLCHYQKCSEMLQMAVELECSLQTYESVGSMGFQVDLPKAQSVFRGKIDSNGTVGAVMETKLAGPFNLSLSAAHNHLKQKFRVGVGFSIF